MSYTKTIQKTFLVTLLALTGSGMVFGQEKTDTLNEVKVTTRHNPTTDVKVNEFSPGQKISTIDSATLQQYQVQSMANLLSQQMPVFVKSYGFNGISTLNFRGASAAQSTVLWNGVPLVNAALGMADVSTLPVLFMNKVHILFGGSSALYGSGNVGGALILEDDEPVFVKGKNSVSLYGGAGSFGQYMGGVKASISGRRLWCSFIAFEQAAVNNFPYTDSSQGVKRTLRMPNARMAGKGEMAHIAYRIADQNILVLTLWHQDYSRLIPPALFESFSDKQQTDASLRILLDWDKKAERNSWYARSSLVRDDVRYGDSAVGVQTNNTVYQYYLEAGWKHSFGDFGKIILFAPIQFAWMAVAANETKEQDKVALAGAYDVSFFFRRLNVAVNARGETINGTGVLLPGADASFSVARWFELRANVQRSYRAPTLNELYYFPGGNTSLRPEQGWNEDAGYSLKAKVGNFSFYQDVSIFNRDIYDWIIWLGGAIWTPHNIADVHSRGVETENNIAYQAGKWKLHVGLNTAYVLATTVSSYIPNDGSIGKQIPYSPRYNGQLNVGFIYKQFSVNYNHTYTGYRFTVTDESVFLLPYQTGNLQLMVNTVVKRHALQLTGQWNNMWNEQYQVVASRPMPGPNWQAGFRFSVL